MKNNMYPKVISIGGSDCSSGAGIQADLKTLSALGVYGQTVITFITAQNTHKIISSQTIKSNIVADQICSLLEDGSVNVIKISILGNKNIIKAVYSILNKINKNIIIIIDPIINSSSGYNFLKNTNFNFFCKKIIPLANILIPNIFESSKLLDCKIANNHNDMINQIKSLYKKFNCNILLKSDNLMNNKIYDIYYDGNTIKTFSSKKINIKNNHGTGCTYASAIAANLAIDIANKQKPNFIIAILKAKNFLKKCIKYSDQLNVGNGIGGLYHFNNQLNWRFNIKNINNNNKVKKYE